MQNKTVLRGLKRLRNLDGIAIIGEKLDGKRVEIEPVLLLDFINFLQNVDSEEIDVEKAHILKMQIELAKLLTTKDYVVVLG